MATTQASKVLQHIRKLAAAKDPSHEADGLLLERFVDRQDDSAFQALVRRHGTLVFGVCRRVLRHEQDAEDAFQATFLVLARKAASIGKKGSLSGWLYKVAYHAAIKARAQAAAKLRNEESPSRSAPRDPLDELTGRELLAVLDEEMQRLPERLRIPLVHCYLQGQTRDQAARQLGWSQSTLQRRLEEGRDRLRGRLERRGVALSVSLLVAGVSQSASAGALPSVLISGTVKAAMSAAAGKAVVAGAPALALANSVVRSMVTAKLKMAMVFLLALGLIGAGIGTITKQVLAQRQGAAQTSGSREGVIGRSEIALLPPGQARTEKQPLPASKPQPSSKEKEKPPEEKRLTLTGRVVGPSGAPIVGAQIAVADSPKQMSRPGEESNRSRALGQTRSGPDGRFQLTLPSTSSWHYHYPKAIASFAGYGLGWQGFDPDAERPEVVIPLDSENVLRGRILNLQGQAAGNAKIHVTWVTQDGRGPSEPDGKMSAWPGPLTADTQGRFVLGGLGRSQNVVLQVRDERFALQELRVAADSKDRAKEIAFSLSPQHILSGQITFADTGKPVADARLLVMAPGGNFFGKADADGRYQIPVSDAKYVHVYAAPAKGQPYLTLKKYSEWPKGVVKHSVDLALPKGIPVKGKITELPSNKPVTGASVQYFPQQTDNPDLRPDVVSLWPAAVDSGPGGEFEITLPPGPTRLLVTGPTPDFIHQEIAYSILADGKPVYGRYSPGPEGNLYFGGQRVYAHGLVPLKLKPGVDPEPLLVTLRRGVTVRGRLFGVDGKPVSQARMLSRLNITPWEHMVGGQTDVFDGRFELRGCDPQATYRVIFFDAIHQQGAVAEIAGKQAGGEPVIVRLAPCGRAKARLVSHDGQPLRNKRVKMDLIVTPGGANFQTKELLADALWISNLDWVHYRDGPRTDAEGCLSLPALIPGAVYRFDSPGRLDAVTKGYSVEAGKTVDWGTLTNLAVFD